MFWHLHGSHCNAEWEQNLKQYGNSERLAPFKSGNNEQHGTWHNVMWDIPTHTQDEKIAEKTEVGGCVTETPAALEKDLLVSCSVGHSIRNFKGSESKKLNKKCSSQVKVKVMARKNRL